jgi:hypothetical protein
VDENRIRVRLESELTPVRLEDKMDLHAEIQVAVDSHLTGLAIFGLVALLVGILAVLVGAIMFALNYPNPWYAAFGSAHYQESRDLIKRIVLFLAGGIVLIFVGTSTFFYGRTVLGSGSLDQFSDSNVEVE